MADQQRTRMVLDDTTKYTDMVVVAAGERIPCHKGVVCYYSEVIDAAMSTPMMEQATGEFKVTDERATAEGVRQFLLSMYNSWDSETMDEHIHEIYRLSFVYGSASVREKAITAFKRLMTVEKFWETVKLANDGRLCEGLIDECKEFACEKENWRALSDVDEEAYKTAMETAAEATCKICAAMLALVKRRLCAKPTDANQLTKKRCAKPNHNTYNVQFGTVCVGCLSLVENMPSVDCPIYNRNLK